MYNRSIYAQLFPYVQRQDDAELPVGPPVQPQDVTGEGMTGNADMPQGYDLGGPTKPVMPWQQPGSDNPPPPRNNNPYTPNPTAGAPQGDPSLSPHTLGQVEEQEQAAYAPSIGNPNAQEPDGPAPYVDRSRARRRFGFGTPQVDAATQPAMFEGGAGGDQSAQPPTQMDPQRQAALSALTSPGMQAPDIGDPTQEGKKAKAVMPEGLSESQQAAWQAEHAENKDHGWKGRIKEIVQNFLYGMSQAQPGTDWRATLGMGAVGAARGTVQRSWNERRAAEARIPQLREKEEYEAKLGHVRAQTANQQNEIANRNFKTQLDIDEATHKKLTAAQKNILDVWSNPNVDFDPDGKDKPYADWAAQNGVVLLKKEKGQKYSAQIAPDGRVLITNTSTGEYRVGNEQLAKPATINEKDVTDAEFGLYDDKQLENMAAAAVAPSMKDRQVRPGVLEAAGFKDEAAYLKAASNGDTSLNASDIYQALPDDYKQRHASTVEKMRKGQTGLRKQVDRFRAILNHRTPTPGADAITLDEAKQWFRQALTKSPKDLEKFFTILQSANIK